ncbi:hypothetical protein CANARDRAFT_7287 [[Candida] arabinofermentans NRRL YB-2248]|uniref:Fatty acid hydroxylase domain-containing protein n=1 Tax=[Candida] arabinofermentans NRRL YB-2248 TaxID=983967 RepID=A0A1E4T2E7_9ASCO|nr:hypothetical protein CANARDRAFT_7287 [[Candida] arabinofermentans NRRL YB-2248]
MTEIFNSTTLNNVNAPSFGQIVSNIFETQKQLNIIEKLWASWYTYMQNDILATGLLFFLTHELTYFGRCLPWYLIDKIPYFRRWKIQPSYIPSDKEQWECMKSVLKSHFLVEALPIWAFHPLCKRLGISVSVPFPSLKTMCFEWCLFFILEDMWHYWAHRLFHYGPFYKYVHKQHHRYAAPFGLTAEYAHPIEVMSLGFGTVGFPIIYAYFTRDLHLFTITCWVCFRLLQAVDAHSGYDFPWSLHNFVPFWAGAEHHDLHHHYFIGNYASSFRWWDYTLDTEAGPQAKMDRERRAKLKADKTAKKRI